MSTDWYTKLVLTVVAVCLALLVYQAEREAQSGGGGSGAEEGRYRLTPMPMARMVLRFDSQTGKTWKALFPDLNAWEPVADTSADRIDNAIREGSEAPAAAAPEPAAPAREQAAPATPASPAPPSGGAAEHPDTP